MAKTVKRHPFQRDWRRDLIIAGLISLLLAIVLLLYTFGLTSDFIFKVFNAFFVIFILVSGTTFFIIPVVNLLFAKFFKKKGTGRTTVPAPKRNMPRARPRET